MREIQWHAGIGDPTPMGWLTVVAYFAAMWLCLRAFMVEKAGPPRPYRQAIKALWRVVRKHWPHPPAPARRAGLWLMLAAILACLGINKQLDLQTLIIEFARVSAIEGGWYEQRRSIQLGSIGAIVVSGAALVVALGWLARGHLRDFRLALGGMAVLVTFVALRATSFHHIDIFIRTEVAGLELNWIFELGGITLVAVAAGRRLRRAGAPLWRGWPPSSGSGGGGARRAEPQPRAQPRASAAATDGEPPVVGKVTQLG